MPTQTTRCLVAMLLITSITACGHRHSANVTNAGAAAPQGAACTVEEQIAVTEGMYDVPHVVLGDVEVTVSQNTIFDSSPTREKVDEAFREEAHELCADAVMLTRYGSVGMSLWSYGAMEAKGRAIRFTDGAYQAQQPAQPHGYVDQPAAAPSVAPHTAPRNTAAPQRNLPTYLPPSQF